MRIGLREERERFSERVDSGIVRLFTAKCLRESDPFSCVGFSNILYGFGHIAEIFILREKNIIVPW